MKKVFLCPIRDDSWERVAEAQFGFTVEIDPRVVEVHSGETIECHVICIDCRVSTKAVILATPRVSKSFPVGIEVALDDQVAQLQVADIATPESIESTPAVRRGLQVRFKGIKPAVWILNTRYETESVVPAKIRR
jgi:hypothetical protein